MGLFDGLLGKKQVEDAEFEQPKEAFFLSADDAKTMGNIDYMRTAKTVKKTFPAGVGREGFEVVETISNQVKFEEGKPAPAAQTAPIASMNGSAMNGASPNGTVAANSERRQADSSMDMFRSMARDIKKK